MPLESWLRDNPEKTASPSLTGTVTGVKVAPAGPLSSETVAVPVYAKSGVPRESVGWATMPKGSFWTRVGGGCVAMTDWLARP